MKIKDVVKWIIYAGVFIVPFIPLVVTNSLFFPYIVGKNIMFRVIVEIIVAAWIPLAIVDKSFRPSWKSLIGAAALFVGVMFIADLNSQYAYKSFWSNFERMEGWVTLIHLLGYLIVTATVIRMEKVWNWLFVTNTAASLLVCLYGFLEYSHNLAAHTTDARLASTLGNAAYLAVYMLFSLFITLYVLFSEHSVFAKLQGSMRRTFWAIGIFVLIIQSFILYQTATRGTVLGVAAGLIVAAVLNALFLKDRPKLRKASIGLIIALIVGGGLFLALKDTSFVKGSAVLSRFASISVSDQTTQSRLEIWYMAYEGFKERPILGWGQESFNYVFNKFYNPNLYSDEQWFDRTHDIVFDWLVAGGILGLGTYLFFYGFLFYTLWRKKSNFSVTERSLLSGLLVGYFVHNLFVFDNIVSYLDFFTIAAYIYYRSTDFAVTPPVEPVAAGNEDTTLSFSLLATGILAFVAIIFVNGYPYEANASLIKALTAPPDQSPALFQQALSYNTFGNPEIREQLMQASVNSLQGTDASTTNALFTLALAQMKIQDARTPQDARYQLFTGSLLDQFQQFADATPYLDTAQTLSPDKQAIFFERVANDIGLKKYDDALAVAKAAYDLAPTFDQAIQVYATAAIYDNQLSLAQSLAPTDLYQNSMYIRAFVETGQFNKVLNYWKAQVAATPNDLSVHISLASVYLIENDTAAALAELQKAYSLATDPSTQAQIQSYIDQVKGTPATSETATTGN